MPNGRWTNGTGLMNLEVDAGAVFDMRTQTAVINELTGSGTIGSSSTAGMVLTVGAQGGNSTFSGLIEDALPTNNNNVDTVGITKAGAGTLTLNGVTANTYSVGTTISGGTLLADNTGGSSTGTGTVTVGPNGTLAGTGQVGAAIVNGTISAGTVGTPGVLGTGNLTLDSTGALVADIQSNILGTGYDSINVSGIVTINNATLTLNTTGYVPTPGDVIVLISSSSGIAAGSTFAGLPEGATITQGGVTFQISYQAGFGTEVVLYYPAPSVQLSAASNTVAEGAGSVTFTVTRNGGTAPTGRSACSIRPPRHGDQRPRLQAAVLQTVNFPPARAPQPLPSPFSTTPWPSPAAPSR